MDMNYAPWVDIKLNEEEMNFLKDAMSEENLEDYRGQLVGNISRSELIEDKNNWFYETVIKKLTERLFYRNWDNYYKYHIEKEEPSPEFRLESLWVNYQKQHEFNPMHDHSSLYSFVVFMKIPTHWKEQHDIPSSKFSAEPQASNFVFISPNTRGSKLSTLALSLRLGPEDEGKLVFFPSELKHQVYPFYGTEEERITISGNVQIGKLLPVVLKESDSEIDRNEMLKHMEESLVIYKQKFFPELLERNKK